MGTSTVCVAGFCTRRRSPGRDTSDLKNTEEFQKSVRDNTKENEVASTGFYATLEAESPEVFNKHVENNHIVRVWDVWWSHTSIMQPL